MESAGSQDPPGDRYVHDSKSKPTAAFFPRLYESNRLQGINAKARTRKWKLTSYIRELCSGSMLLDEAVLTSIGKDQLTFDDTVEG